jgi:hypothetical protein
MIVMLCLEGWLRALEPGGQIARLIPPRADESIRAQR